ncbi:MAG: hypothetical protein ACK2U9_06085, partial [Anaerolineae bacterium]
MRARRDQARSSRPWRLALISLPVLLAGLSLVLVANTLGAAGASAPSLPGTGTAGGQSPASMPDPGVYVFLDNLHLDPEQYPYVVGGHQVFLWNEVETNEQGVYDWSRVEQWLNAEADLGKPTAIGFNSYDGAGLHRLPAWYLQQHPDGYVTCSGTIIPKYWSNSYKQAWSHFVQAVAARYDNDPRVAWVEISTGIYGETMPSENQFDACLEANGLSSSLWVQTVNEITDIYHAAWQNKPIFIQYAPFYLSRIERRDFTDYAGTLGVGMKHDKLLVDHDDQVIDDPDYYFFRAGQYDPMFTFLDQVPSAWEVYRDFLPTEADVYWAMLNGLNKHPSYFLVKRNLLTDASPLEQATFHFANRYAGRTVDDTPSVWIALRETQSTWYPQRGNFDFWLYQNDAVPGGQTVPLWNVTGAAQGLYARRTDGATGNPYMYFDVDDDYIQGGTNVVSVTVTYLD